MARVDIAGPNPHSRTATIVVDLGFGDAGKGTITDWLARRQGAHCVVRFNGGAQAAHHVVTDDGRQHTFSQLGAGSFVPGVKTHLSRFVVVHPTGLLVEAEHLEGQGVTDALSRLTISENALLITPPQQAAGRLRELSRAHERHGSCGVGVGEAVMDALRYPEHVLRAGDLADKQRLHRKLTRIQELKRCEMAGVTKALRGYEAAEAERIILEDSSVLERWAEPIDSARLAKVVVGDDFLGRLLGEDGSVVFEGAQGVLLDEWRGFHPFTTWSTCTFDNALELLREHEYAGDVTRLGVLRTYATRHGPGPFPSECHSLTTMLTEPNNPTGPWQGAFRSGWPDPVLWSYAIEACGGVDRLALTHVDALARVPEWRACVGYELATESGAVRRLRLGEHRDLIHQEALSRALLGARPVFQRLEGDAERYIEWLEAALGVRVWVSSSGPRAGDKRVVGGAPDV